MTSEKRLLQNVYPGHPEAERCEAEGSQALNAGDSSVRQNVGPRNDTVGRARARGQAPVEVAVFGSILIFIIGAIVSQASSAAFTQNFNLRALREAIDLSTDTTDRNSRDIGGCKNSDGQWMARSIDLLIVEDRLAPGVFRFGPTERAPIMASASAALNKDLFHTIEFGWDCELPRQIVRINGVQKIYKTAGFGEVNCPNRCYVRQPWPYQDRMNQPVQPPRSWYWGEDPWADVKKDVVDNEGSHSCDINNDYEEETIIGIVSPSAPYCPWWAKYIPLLKKLICDGGTSFPPKCQYVSGALGDYNPSDKTQGLRPDMKIITQVLDGTSLTIVPKTGRSDLKKKQVDVACRLFRLKPCPPGTQDPGHCGDDWFCTQINQDWWRTWSKK